MDLFSRQVKKNVMVSRNPSWVCSGHNLTYNAKRKPRAVIYANITFRQLTQWHKLISSNDDPAVPHSSRQPRSGHSPSNTAPQEEQSRLLPTGAVKHSEASLEAKLSTLYQTKSGAFGVQGTMSRVHSCMWNKWLEGWLLPGSRILSAPQHLQWLQTTRGILPFHLLNFISVISL